MVSTPRVQISVVYGGATPEATNACWLTECKLCEFSCPQGTGETYVFGNLSPNPDSVQIGELVIEVTITYAGAETIPDTVYASHLDWAILAV